MLFVFMRSPHIPSPHITCSYNTFHMKPMQPQAGKKRGVLFEQSIW